MEKIKLELTQEAYLCSNGNNQWYEAHAIDWNRNDYIVFWEIKDDFNTRTDDDESYACDWDYPSKVTDENGTVLPLSNYEVI